MIVQCRVICLLPPLQTSHLQLLFISSFLLNAKCEKGKQGHGKVEVSLYQLLLRVLELEDTYVDTPTLVNKLSKMNA